MKSKTITNVKEKIRTEDDLMIDFKKKLENIKQKYGIEFDVELLKNGSIDKIKFSNLKYKNKAHDMSVVYFNEYGYYGAYIYTINKNSSMKGEDYITKRNYLHKEYKLDLIIDEIKKVNDFYKAELQEIIKIFKNRFNNNPELEKRYNNTEN